MEKNTLENTTHKLLDVLGREQSALEKVLEAQAAVRRAVREKNWGCLESSLQDFGEAGKVFNALEDRRGELCRAICGDEAGNDMFILLRHVPDNQKEALLEAFTQVRRLLAQSRVENSALGDYVKVCLDFLRGIFETAIPGRKSRVYTRTGAILQSQPERLIFDAVL
jgi:hypothetical protein